MSLKTQNYLKRLVVKNKAYALLLITNVFAKQKNIEKYEKI